MASNDAISNVTFGAAFFDGQTARRSRVSLRLSGETLILTGEDGLETQYPGRDARSHALSERLPLVVELPAVGRLEIAPSFDAQELGKQLRALQSPPAREARRARTSVLASVAGLGLLLLATAIFARTPAACRYLSFGIPDSSLNALGDRQLASFESELFLPSALDASRQARITKRFQKFSEEVAPGAHANLLIRADRTGIIGINAFALPNGDILLFDATIDFAGSDDAVLGILAHELGHIVLRHAASQILEESLVGGLIAFSFGGAANLESGAARMMLSSRFSRAQEQEADEFAANSLRAAGISTRDLKSFFQRIAAKSAGDGGGIPFLSTHPRTEDRLRTLSAASQGRKS